MQTPPDPSPLPTTHPRRSHPRSPEKEACGLKKMFKSICKRLKKKNKKKKAKDEAGEGNRCQVESVPPPPGNKGDETAGRPRSRQTIAATSGPSEKGSGWLCLLPADFTPMGIDKPYVFIFHFHLCFFCFYFSSHLPIYFLFVFFFFFPTCSRVHETLGLLLRGLARLFPGGFSLERLTPSHRRRRGASALLPSSGSPGLTGDAEHWFRALGREELGRPFGESTRSCVGASV